MDIKSLALPPQTEEQKKKKRKETAGLIQSFSKNSGLTELARNNFKELMFNPAKEAEKALIGAVRYSHLLKEEEDSIDSEKQRESIRISFQETQERFAQQQQNHKQMLIDVQVEANRIIEAEKLAEQGNDKQQVNIDAGKGSKNKPKIFDRRLTVLKDWLKDDLELIPSNETTVLPKRYTLELVYNELCKKDDSLFLCIELGSFDAHFWGKQKIVELMRGNKIAISK
jgi:peptidyl-tRNA hydrolase